MILFRRGKEPGVLASIRTEELKRVRAEKQRGESMSLGDRYNHREVRAALYEAQQWKCGYCEIVICAKGYPIDHFRPKSKARRGEGFPEHGYWWLTWNWENLVLTCPACNGTKLDQFPLDPASKILVQGRRPPGLERPLLIDPTSDTPWEHIYFVRLNGRWRPIPRNGSKRGEATIRTIGLDAPDRIEAYTHHVKHNVEPFVNAVKARIAAHDRAGINAAWHEMRRVLFGPKAPYQALAYDAIAALLPAAQRTPFKLALHRPAVRTHTGAPSSRKKPRTTARAQ